MTIQIAVVGTIASGSTRLYNLIRITFERLNYNINSCFELDKKPVFSHNHVVSESNPNQLILKKLHDCNYLDIENIDFILLPIRHLLDAAISTNKRYNRPLEACINDNVYYFTKFRPVAHFIFFYEKYSLEYVKELYTSIENKVGIKINLNDEEILSIIKELDELLFAENLPVIDNGHNPVYKKTMLSKHHNTSNGKSNKFLTEMTKEQIKSLLSNKKAYDIIVEQGYLPTVEQFLS